MSLIVESGTGSATSESYCSVADASAYHTARGNVAWAALASDTVREQALRKATDYIGQVYRSRWAGSRVSSIQTLDWPRAYVPRDDLKGASIENLDFNGGIYFYPNDEVPTEVKNACAELALKSASGDLLPDLTQGIIRERVDVLETEYDKYSSQLPRYSAIDRMLMPFLRGSSASRTVVRA